MTYSELANWDGSLTRREAQVEGETPTQTLSQTSVQEEIDIQTIEAEIETPEFFTSPLSSPKALSQPATSIQDFRTYKSNFEDLGELHDVKDAPQNLSLGSGLLEVRALLFLSRKISRTL